MLIYEEKKEAEPGEAILLPIKQTWTWSHDLLSWGLLLSPCSRTAGLSSMVFCHALFNQLCDSLEDHLVSLSQQALISVNSSACCPRVGSWKDFFFHAASMFWPCLSLGSSNCCSFGTFSMGSVEWPDLQKNVQCDIWIWLSRSLNFAFNDSCWQCSHHVCTAKQY